MTGSLAHFPPDILGLILGSESSSFLVLRLWTCGNTILNSKLSTGLTFLCLKAMWSGHRGIPTLIQEFTSLRYLSLHSRAELLKNPADWQKVIKSFPRTLETLKLCSGDSKFALLNASPNKDMIEPEYIYSTYERGRSRFIDIGAYFPRLHTLGIDASSTHSFWYSSVSPSDFPALPPTLTRLIAQFTWQEPFLWSLLPKSLIYLDAGLVAPKTDSELESWSQAPPSLEHISWLRIDSDTIQGDWIPNSLTSARFNNLGPAYLPPHLKSVLIQVHPALLRMPELPIGLTTLHIDSFVGAKIPLLSPSLTELAVHSFSDFPSLDKNNSAANPIWPSGLRSLQIGAAIDASQIALLPRSLLALTLSLSPQPPENAVVTLESGILPPLLSNLVFHFANGITKLNVNGALPPAITSLQILNRTQLELSVISTQNLFIAGLHSFTARLNMDIHQSGLWRISETLRLINVEKWFFEDLKLLPSALTNLTVFELNSDTKNGTQTPWKDVLPLSLKYLAIMKTQENISLPDVDSFSHLSALRSMNLVTPHLPSAIVRYLPPYLRALNIHLKHLEEVDAPFLPRFLESINFEDSDEKWWTPIVEQHWPSRAPRPHYLAYNFEGSLAWE